MTAVTPIRLVLGTVAALLSGPAWADTVPLDAFFGTWQPAALTQDADQQALGVQPSDLAAVIGGTRRGFSIRWTRLAPAAGDPNQTAVARQPAELAFEATEWPGLFDTDDSGNPMEGETLSWARLHDNVLTLYQFVVQDDGLYVLTTTDRTVEGDTMRFDFRLIVGGAPVRLVTGQLTRTAG